MRSPTRISFIMIVCTVDQSLTIAIRLVVSITTEVSAVSKMNN